MGGVVAAGRGVSCGPLGGAWWVGGVVFWVGRQAGDLMASMLKRDVGVKDSGSSLPGMGGLIDVLDSPLLVFPAAYWILTYGLLTAQ